MREMIGLIGVFSYLSLLTIGGGMAAYPEMKTLTVDTFHWLTADQLVRLYSLGQMAPGPNMMMIAGIGEWVAGPIGALAVTLAFFLPTGFLTFWVGRVWEHLSDWPWRASIQRALNAVSIGLLLAGVVAVGKAAITGWAGAAIAFSVFGVLMLTHMNPLPLMALAGVAGALLFR
ncbi:chromate transporter [Methylocystis parvus]|uniref:Chromate transporter n=1 Tax=Methylocystis parvus TaxID=134 RepID=A0A6B8M409_9HYPH|nr:chromate transporter [Methylocystis parvus]QGM97641.1 chromate transporter [Methylocystis parvus]WBJ98425.1 chromate transporter [Methylocystis parvus OBBP]